MAARDRPAAMAPAFLELAGHGLRWRLLRELARSDRRVRELVALVDEPQSLVSYHLGRLRAPEAGLVARRRSAADGRDCYYRLDLARCADLLSAAGGALHPALGPTAIASDAATRSGRRTSVLFLCSGNSARSQLAEALVQRLSNGAVDAYSAGSDPKPMHPYAIRVAHEHGVDMTGRRSKHLSRFVDRRFDVVISLCDRVREVCPEFPHAAEVVHWSIPDPSGGTDEGSYPAFQAVAAELEQRIRAWLLTIPNPNPGGRHA